MNAAIRLALFAAAAAACAPRDPSPVPYANGPACDSVVAAHRANPDAPVDREPEATAIRLPPADAPRAVRGKTHVIRYVVTEQGTVDPASIEVPSEFPERFAADVRSSLAAWTFVPARAGQCWVAARYSYQL